MEENANFAQEMTGLKVQLKEKINWKQVDLVMVFRQKVLTKVGMFGIIFGINLNANFRAKNSAILNKIAGKSPTQMP
jgi:hypothetical protein